MVFSSAALVSEGDCSCKAQKELIVRVIYRFILSPEKVLHIKKPAIVKQKTKI
jgi:hypothetical protein